MPTKKPKQERYLKIPNHILNAPELGLCEKVLLAHIYSFAAKGCWQSNATLAELFMTSACTISRRVAKLAKFVYVKKPKGYYRTLWAKSHPDVAAEARLHYRKNAKDPTQKCAGDLGKSASGLTQKCATTNNKTIKEIIKETTATPPPLPAGGQASALLTDRKEHTQDQIKNLSRNFGKARKRYKSLSCKQFEQNKQNQIKALLAGTKK